MRSLFAIAGLVIVMACATAMADHDITVPYEAPEGTAVIDGDLSEWAGDTWIMLDEQYSPTATDVTEAKYALRWSSATNLVYVAVSVTDTVPLFEDHWVSWNTQDDVELYIDAGENDTLSGGVGGMGNYGTYQDYAQQMAMGYHAAGTWANFGWMLGEDLNICPEYVAAFDGVDTITYEAAFTPYSYYTGFGGAELPEAIVTLAADMLIGFDVVVGAMKDADTANFAMLSNNLIGGKFKWSISMQTWLLVGGGTTLQADFDGDGDVDLDDFVILKTNFGIVPPANGDADGDGDVDLDDFVILKNEFGS